MNTQQNFCSLNLAIKYIKLMKKSGIKNQEIIKQLMKKGCAFNTIFDAMDEVSRKT